jgi:septal ring factor EnvC (AmiA/AmiB activator)
MNVNKSLTGAFLLLFVCFFSYGQKSKEQLEKEKQANLKKIEQTEKILAETAGKKQNTMGRLNALNQRIAAQEDLIQSIRNEINLLNDEIEENKSIIQSLEQDVTNLKNEYSAMVYATYKANQGFNKLTFLFSAATFNQFLMRLQYMEQYGEVRKKQAEQIKRVQETLSGQVIVIESQMTEKNMLLGEQLAENRQLEELKGNQSQLVNSLQKQEKEIKKDLEDTRKAVARLDKMINDIIREEIERARRAETATAAATVKLSMDFAQNKNKLPWPVSGFVVQKFGKQSHPVFKNVVIDSHWITIQTKQSEMVKTVFNGEIARVAFVPLVGNTVIINHGDYFSVYAGLKEVLVKQGQKVTTNQEIGSILTNKDGVSELKFEIRKSANALDPQQWLANN